MRLLWISCLLVGSITCLPVQDFGAAAGGEPNPRGYHPGPWVSGPASPDPTVPSTTTKPDQQVKYGYGGYPGVYGGYPGVYSYQSTDQTSDQTPDGPFFTDVSDLDPVYNFHSRSRYRRGRAHFSQTRYVPTDSLYSPVFSYPGYLPPQGYLPPKGDQVPVKAY